MFKKKADIPPRPTIPTVEQIIEDIEHSSPDDNLFLETFTAGESQSMSAQQKEAEDVYCQVKQFVDANGNLKEVLHRLKDQNEALKISDMELKAMAEDIRKQALDALQ